MAVRILLADDHALPRALIQNVISERRDWRIVAEACDVAEAVAMANEECPDIAILDIQMPRLNGVNAAKKILEKCPSAIILTDSSFELGPLYKELIKAGVRGFVAKTQIGTNLIPAIETVLKGGEWFWFAPVRPSGGQLASGIARIIP